KVGSPCQHARVLIDDPDDTRVADYRAAVRDRASRLFLCEGRLLVSRLLAAPRFRARSILATPRALEDLREALGPAPPPVFVASTATMRAIFFFTLQRGGTGPRESAS